MADIDGPRYVMISPVKSKSYVKMFHSTLTFPFYLSSKLCSSEKTEFSNVSRNNKKNLFFAIVELFCRQAAKAKQAGQKEQDDAQHVRQVEMRKAELKAEVQKAGEQEKTKRLEIQQQLQLAKNEQQRIEAREIAKLKLEEEKTKQLQFDYQDKRDRANDRARQSKLEYETNAAKSELEVWLEQEKSNRVKAQNEQKRMETEAVEHTKQLEIALKIVTKLVQIGTDKTTINTQLSKMLGGEFPEEIGKVNIPSFPNTTKFKNITKEQLKVRKIRPQSVHN